MGGKVSRSLHLQNTILIKMIKEIKRKWNQHKCIPSPQNKDYWRNCWAFLELQASTETIQTDAGLGYKISILVCFWSVCFVATNVTGKQSWWQMFWVMLSTTTWGEPKSVSPRGCIFKRWGPKAFWPEKPHHLLPCQLSHNEWFYAWF